MQEQKFKLNSEQVNAAQEILDWFDAGKRQEFILQAPPGRGKTFTLQKIVEQRPDIKPAYLATTNAAANLLRGGKTVHSFLNLRPKTHGAAKVLSQSDEPVIKDENVLFIDEMSMMSSDIWDFAKATGLPILYSGDKYQLPPIETDLFGKPLEFSPVFDAGIAEATLTTNMRSHGALSANSDAIRDGIITGKFVDGQKAMFLADTSSLWKESLNAFQSKLRSDDLRVEEFFSGNAAVGCATWKTIDMINGIIRRVKFGAAAVSKPYIIGDIIIFKETLMKKDSSTDQKKEFARNVQLTSNTIGKVVKITETLSPFVHQNDSSMKIPVYELELETTAGNVICYVPTQMGELKLTSYLGSIANAAKAADKGNRYTLWEKFHYMKEVHAQIAPAYARTVNRLQGASIDTIYSFIPDLLKTSFGSTQMAYRRLMVSNSRAKERLIYVY